MKHIKLFESYKKDEFYQRINSVDFNKVSTYDGNPYSMNRNIKDIVKNAAWTSYDTENNTISFRCEKPGGFSSFFIKFDEDEWFRVTHVKPRQPPEYYKCDQFSGLEELLKDLGVC